MKRSVRIALAVAVVAGVLAARHFRDAPASPGESSRSSSQRHSLSARLSSQVGRAMAPARCTTAVSTLITRSSPAISAAVASKSTSSSRQSCTLQAASVAASASPRGSLLNLTQDIPGRAKRGANSRKASSKRCVCTARLPVVQFTPTLAPGKLAKRARHCATAVGQGTK